MQKGIKILVLLLAMAMLAGCGQQQQPLPQLQEPVGVQPDTAAAYIGEIYNIAYVNSAVVPYVEELFFETDGTIGAIHCYPGMEVKEGDALIELDQSGLEERVKQLEEELEHTQHDGAYADALAQADIQLLQLELAQLQEQAASDQEIALKKNEIAQKQASLRQTQALRELDMEAKQEDLEKLRRSMGNHIIYASFSGRVIWGGTVQEGSRIAAYKPVLFLADDTKLHLSGDYIARTQINSADMVYALIGGAQYEIEMRPMDQEEYVSSLLAGETLRTQFDIIGPEALLNSVEAGQYAAICICTDYVENALLIPGDALMKDATGSYVYVDENGTRVRRMVKVGKSTQSLVQILDGLEEGDVVYVKG